jgi:hypothetical protein
MHRKHSAYGFPFAILLIFVVIQTLIGAALAADSIGYVATLTGVAELTRGSAPPRGLLLGETILRGDRIKTARPNIVRVDTRQGRIEICGPSEIGNSCDHLFDSGQPIFIADWWRRARDIIAWRGAHPTNLVVRSSPETRVPPPRILIGNGKPQNVAFGKRPLTVVWFDGMSPFTVLFKSGEMIVSRMDTEIRTITLVDIPRGAVSQVEVRDKNGERAVITLHAVSRIPQAPKLNLFAVDADHAALLEAAWLATQENGAWLLESFNSLDEISSRLPAAAAMRNGLAAGDVP